MKGEKNPMTGREIAVIRRRAEMGVAEFGVAIGLKGSDSTVARAVRRMEANDMMVPSRLATAAERIDKRARERAS